MKARGKHRKEITKNVKLHTNCLIDHLFTSNNHKHGKHEEQNDHESGKFKKFGKNLISEKNNKYFFRLLQIFGFRDESMLSFINKEQFKLDLLKASVENTYGSEDIFEQFLIDNCIK